ncbi:50S ribosome-binding GTPase [Butyrivibrio sp. DSM 10294]|uniref:GTPase n=1 Tax=Butyrivibrio sp. DSM 10294 TaxID=2972457 RepID=UPI00234EC550|nr:GTPase [Butyrivibrio sp. DSM 10294]MDC7292710.1 50S ribosome-binding GTPase [Butyrivibrio sp. DSM 10294]
MEKGNVLVIGFAGVGKSTLIKTVLGEEVMESTKKSVAERHTDFQVYENKNVPFRLIDTTGIEPGVFKEQKAVNAVKKWSESTIKSGKKDKQISAIWFCVDRYTAKLFPKTIDSFMNAISSWKNAPIVAVITQSYTDAATSTAKEVVEEAFLSKKKYMTRLAEVVSVIAMPRAKDDGEILPPKGITELIEITNSLLPEGIQAAEKDIARYNLTRKRAMSHAVVSVATLAGITVGGIASPVIDVMLLKPTESLEIQAIFKIWGIRNTKKAKELVKLIVDIGTVSITGKMLVSALKVIPGVNLGAAAVNAAISGTIVFALGEAAAYIFEQIYTGKKTLNDMEWVQKVVSESISSTALDKITDTVKGVAKNADKNEILDAVASAFAKNSTA